MDVKEKIEEIVEKLKKNPALLAKFKEEPLEALREVTGLDLPEEQLKPVITGIQAKLGADNVADVLGKLGKLF